MLRYVAGPFLFFVMVCVALAQTSPPLAEIQNALSRAEALYYQAQFQEAIEVLAPLDLALQEQHDNVQESVRVKLQLALAYVGLNEMPAAKARFDELCALAPEYELDPQLFAPKVVALFNAARTDQTTTRCSAVCIQAKRLLETGDSAQLVGLVQSGPKGCSCLQGLGKDAADLFYKQGVEAYKQDDFVLADRHLRTALAFDSRHELALLYMDLTQDKLQLRFDRLVVDWYMNFETREFAKSSAIYRQLASPNLTEKAAAVLEQIRAEYRKEASAIVEAWNQKCSTDPQAMSDTIKQATIMLPDPEIANDIVNQITVNRATPCIKPAPIDPESCLQVMSQAAMTRLKSRVTPEVPRFAQLTEPVRVLVKVLIDKNGNVTVKEVESSNGFLRAPVKAAIEQWKFAPAVVAGQPRCVETELPIMLIP